MTARDRLPPWHERHRLANGRELLIRPIRPEDAEPLRAGYALLEPSRLRDRLAGATDLTEAAADRLARPNPRTEFALVASEPEDPGTAVLAAVAYAQTDPAAHEGVFTILVSRFVAGLGVRRYLLTRIAKWARSRGVGALHGELPRSPDVLQLAQSLGFQLHEDETDPSMVRVSLDVPRR
ncbi:GNAT family N-acetyltransferase [Cognatilysobacter segetis]|uniref:GNAT family N-acetyltransferase n=1 Tax=Cognatilysobacter segetis TaxID=2492394 RepID=UPI00192E6465|nr:N-acetyltransferase [Lysobacter segetis]